MLKQLTTTKIKVTKKWPPFLIFLTAATILIILGFLTFKLFEKGTSNIKEAATSAIKSTLTTSTVTEAKISKSQTVCLDPGHGGKDVGATYGKLYEADINLDVALQVREILEEDGYKVYMTRTTDETVAKRARANYCNSVNATILVSIHHNSYSTDHTVDYSTALYYKDSDQLLASSILNANSEELAIKSEGISKFDNSLLWVAKMPAALSEAFFITNKSEYSSITESNSSRLSEEAKSISAGIVNYFTRPETIKTTISANSLNIDRTDLGD